MKQINNKKIYQFNIFNACFFGSFMKKHKPLSILYLAFLLLAISNSAFAIDLRTYVPSTPGNQWSWTNSNDGTNKTSTLGSPVTLPSGVVAIPSTTIDSGRSGISVTYSTVDAKGLRRWQEYASEIFVPDYGNTSLTLILSPGMVLAPANVSIGSTYTSKGKANFKYTNGVSVNLNYTSSTQVVGFETVSNNSGTQSWSALKTIFSFTVSGKVKGQFYTQSTVATSWLVDGLGAVQTYGPNESNVMEMWKLNYTNVIPVPAPTITTVSPASGPLAAGTAFTITGTNFTGATSVRVNGVAATSVVVVSATYITAKTPAGTAGARSVAVTTVGGTATLESGFTYVAKPTIASISPKSGPTSGDTEITITGTKFNADATVKVNGVAATSVVVVSATSITAVTPSGTAGAKSVAVTIAGGTATKAKAFTYTSSFTGDKTDSSGSGTGGKGRATTTKANGADASAAQATTNPAAETIVAAPMGVELYLQTISQHADAQVVCADASAASVDVVNAFTDNVDAQAIDLDHNGEADICQLRGGDLNLNGVVDDADMSILLDIIGTEPLYGIGDLDGNGVIDSADMRLLLLKVK